MAQSFLEYVVDDLNKKEVNLAECSFVLPSKRSGIFLKKHIAAKLGKTIFSPKIWSIQDFIADQAGLHPATNIDLLLELYNAYRKSKVTQLDDFSSFLKWGNTLLQDYNEIDSHLIPVHNILNYISAIKELDHWSVKKQKTELVQNYLQLWGNLESIYELFSATLKKQGNGYPGLIQRTAVENISQYAGNLEDNKQLVFVGFNALSSAEEKIIQYFLESQNALIYWDIDSYFLNDPVHDAGLFIRKYQREWPYYKNRESIKTHDHFRSPKKITITGVPKNISQTKYVGKLLQHIQTKPFSAPENTALVLADESLLSPMLQAIPTNVEKANITMGLPLKETVLYSFFHDFLELRLAVSNRGYFYKPVLELLANPYCKTLSNNQKYDFAQVLTDQIKQKNWIYVSTDNLIHHEEENDIITQILPKDKVPPAHWIDTCINLIEKLRNIFQSESNALELERLYRFYTLFNQLRQYLSQMDFEPNMKSIKNLFKQLASMETLDFIGEPLTGLQIMGVLESRNLDFDTVIITSVNEGILPSGKSNNSFVPFDVKRDYGLPTYKEKDAIFVYHFYRLIQRAKNIFITYNTEPDVLEGGEMSRLVSQLLTDSNLESYITHNIASPPVKLQEAPRLHIEKTGLLIEEIKSFAAKGFSPTSLTNYIKNPIEFYTRNILRINDLDEVEENIAANTFGTILHNCLEDLYAPLVGQMLTIEKITGLNANIDGTLRTNFQRTLPGIDITKGQYVLVYNVIAKYLQNFILLEAHQLKNNSLKLIALEKKYSVPLEIPQLDFPVVLKGTLDRIDEYNGITRIIDFKTGRVEARHVAIKDWEELLANYDKSKAFQLLCYAYLYMKEHQNKELQAGIYAFKTLGKGLFSFKEQNSSLITSDTLLTFEKYLEQLVLEICDARVTLVEKQD
ncbi:PD-(D/E)XK nuclease family protein [Muricauda sp. JGD-17]|uniref:PD-(D/E)XK nuclease family protein n=1 Tax=Flagellimonas ochracea TaxID=2696472 RepID=A0A964WXP0_9FLAO|nr:PD-(D/E)XK nuclease family protein [Allomuricauda ochracea]NAY91794.1 PD-(D/E)XK nuclease family protein [Allomuricauda ochracea]